jgi:hypothetical protein
MLKAIFAFAGFVVALVYVIGYLSCQSPPKKQGEAAEAHNQTKDNCASPYAALKTGLVASWEFAHEAHEEIIAVATIFIAFFTITLGLSTVSLAGSTRDLVKGADKTSARQLRAYIAAYPNRISDFDESTRASANFHITNHGETPAYNLTHRSKIVVAPFPLPDDYVFPEIEVVSSPMVVMPNTSPTGYIRADALFTRAEIEGIIERSRRVYIYGEVLYETIFHKDCWTTFNASVTGDEANLKKLVSIHLRTEMKISFDMTRIGNDADRN